MAQHAYHRAVPVDSQSLPFPMERRRGERFTASVPAQLRLLVDDSLVHARAADLGETGIQLHSRRKLPVGAVVDVDVELFMPMQVRLGFDLDALVIDGPPVSHFARLRGVVRRCERRPDRRWTVGVELLPNNDSFSRQVLDTYLEHLRDEDEMFLL